MTQEKTIQKRRFEGTVVSVAENKTIHVRVETRKTHPKYHKQYSQSKKYAVHDEHGRAQMGDTVSCVECRPLSKTKRWTLMNIIKKAIV